MKNDYVKCSLCGARVARGIANMSHHWAICPKKNGGYLFRNQRLLALSWKQPYAGLMLHGKVETRTWHTNYRGWVLICSSKQPYSLSQELDISGTAQFERISLVPSLDLSTGVALAVGRLVDCRPMREEDEDSCFVKFRLGLFCHFYDDVIPIKQIGWIGSQGWKVVPEEFKKTI